MLRIVVPVPMKNRQERTRVGGNDSGDLMARMADACPDALFLIDAEGTLVWANRACEHVLGWPAQEIVGRNVVEYSHPDDIPLVLASLDSVQAREVGAAIEVRSRHPSGEWRAMEIVARNCLDDPAVNGIVCSVRDLSGRRMWEVASGDDTRIHRVLQYAPAVVLLLDEHGTITSANAAFTRLLGWDTSAFIGGRLVGFAADEHDRARLAAALTAAAPDARATVEVVMAMEGGGDGVPMRFEIANLLDDPLVGGLAVTGYDITELHDARRQLEHLATHDALTDLPNRTLLARTLGELLAGGRPLALLYVDLDRFKPVNDSFGHSAGDEVLRRIAQRLADVVATTDVVARVGGDEFVVVAVGVADARAAMDLAERLRVAVEAPFDLPTGAVFVGASIGVALAGPGSTAETLLQEADVDMYAIKGPRRVVAGD